MKVQVINELTPKVTTCAAGHDYHLDFERFTSSQRRHRQSESNILLV